MTPSEARPPLHAVFTSVHITWLVFFNDYCFLTVLCFSCNFRLILHQGNADLVGRVGKRSPLVFSGDVSLIGLFLKCLAMKPFGLGPPSPPSSYIASPRKHSLQSDGRPRRSNRFCQCSHISLAQGTVSS